MMQQYLALVPYPLEEVCAAELKELGVHNPLPLRGAVSFQGDIETLYRVNLWSRTAMRILVRLDDFVCHTGDDLYEAVSEISWEDWFSGDSTFAVKAQGQTSALTHSVYTGQRIKDAIVDRCRNHLGRRPTVDPEDPHVQIHAQLYQQEGEPRCALSLDSSGKPLSYRGYRSLSSEAPLKESLAAAILRLANVHNAPVETPIFDPFCGSGTFVIEAALMKHQIAPGLFHSFAFERWPHFHSPLWQKLLKEAQETKRPESKQPLCYGSDSSEKSIQLAKAHAKNARLFSSVQFSKQTFEQITPPGQAPGILVCNPPYGERMGEEQDLAPLYHSLGDVMKQRFSRWNAYIFTASMFLSRQVGLRPKRRIPVFNGPLEGRLLHFELY